MTAIDDTTTSEEPSPPEELGSWHAIARAVALLNRRKRTTAAAMGLAVGVAAARLLVPWLFGLAVKAVEDEDEELVVMFGVAILGAGVLVALLSGLLRWTSGRLAIDVEVALRDRLYQHYLDLGDDFHARQSVGELVSRLMVASGPIRSFLAFSVPRIVHDLLTVVIAGILILFTSPQLALAVLWPIPISVWLVIREAKVITPLIHERQVIEATATGVAEDSLRGMEELDDLDARDIREAAFDETIDEWLETTSEAARLSSRYDAALENVPFLAYPCLFLIGGWAVIDGSIELHQFVTISGFVGLILAPITALSGQLWTSQQAAASAQRVFEVLDQPGLTTGDEDAAALDEVRGDIDIRGVTTSFDGERLALDTIELAIASHRNVVIVGPTGSGKSILLDLVARTRPPDGGTIEIDGQSIDGLRLPSLRAHIRRVDDTPHVFPMTVRENLVYGAPDTTDDELHGITRMLGLHEEILALAHGYDTEVGVDGGLALPTELAQWVTIARAFVTRPDVVLLDDITAGLPPDVERAVVEGLIRLTERSTVVAVAKRPALLSIADVVVVLDQGRVATVGSFEEVRESSSIVADLLSTWQLEVDE